MLSQPHCAGNGDIYDSKLVQDIGLWVHICMCINMQ